MRRRPFGNLFGLGPWQRLEAWFFGDEVARRRRAARRIRKCIYCQGQPLDRGDCPCAHAPCIHQAQR